MNDNRISLSLVIFYVFIIINKSYKKTKSNKDVILLTSIVYIFIEKKIFKSDQ